MNKGIKILTDKTEYGKIAAMLESIPFNTFFANSVLISNSRGKVMTDDLKNPSVYYISQSYGMSLLFGNHTNRSFNESLVDFINNKDRSRKNFEWLQVYPNVWNDTLKQLPGLNICEYSDFSPLLSQEEIKAKIETARTARKIIQWHRINFSFTKRIAEISFPSGYSVKKIDADTYDQIKGAVIPCNFWLSKELFLKQGIGFSLFNQNNELVAISFSSYLSGKNLEIGVETMPKFRGMGFGKIICNELISYCLKEGYTPIWSCRKENFASYYLAKSLGFTESYSLPYYELVAESL